MARRRRRLTRREAIHRAIMDCSNTLARAYNHPEVLPSDLRRIIAALMAMHVDRGESLSLTVKEH